MNETNVSYDDLLKYVPAKTFKYIWKNTGGRVINYRYNKYSIDCISYGDVDYVTHISKYNTDTHRMTVVQKLYGDQARSIYEHAQKHCR